MNIAAPIKSSIFDKVNHKSDIQLLDCPHSASLDLGSVILNDAYLELNISIAEQENYGTEQLNLTKLMNTKSFAVILGLKFGSDLSWTDNLTCELGINIKEKTHQFIYNLEEVAASMIAYQLFSPLVVKDTQESNAVKMDLGVALMRKILVDFQLLLLMVENRNLYGTNSIITQTFSEQDFIKDRIFNFNIRNGLIPLNDMLDTESEAFKFINSHQEKTYNKALELLKQ